MLGCLHLISLGDLNQEANAVFIRIISTPTWNRGVDLDSPKSKYSSFSIQVADGKYPLRLSRKKSGDYPSASNSAGVGGKGDERRALEPLTKCGVAGALFDSRI